VLRFIELLGFVELLEFIEFTLVKGWRFAPLEVGGKDYRYCGLLSYLGSIFNAV
jgi:hypothetical protein